MTLIVYKDGELIADRLVVHKSQPHPGIVVNTEHVEGKLVVTPDNDFAYVFDNDQLPEVIDPILIYLRRFEIGALKEDEPVLEFKDNFRLVVLSRRNFYTLDNADGKLLMRVGNKDVYISPGGSYRYLESLKLTALEIYKVMAFNDQFMISQDHDQVRQKSLTLIRKKR